VLLWGLVELQALKAQIYQAALERILYLTPLHQLVAAMDHPALPVAEMVVQAEVEVTMPIVYKEMVVVESLVKDTMVEIRHNFLGLVVLVEVVLVE
tara:strand:- start:258 stop:545 length:288 start_codon:yes stop_codon:yes gene_type:complete